MKFKSLLFAMLFALIALSCTPVGAEDDPGTNGGGEHRGAL